MEVAEENTFFQQLRDLCVNVERETTVLKKDLSRQPGLEPQRFDIGQNKLKCDIKDLQQTCDEIQTEIKEAAKFSSYVNDVKFWFEQQSKEVLDIQQILIKFGYKVKQEEEQVLPAEVEDTPEEFVAKLYNGTKQPKIAIREKKAALISVASPILSDVTQQFLHQGRISNKSTFLQPAFPVAIKEDTNYKNELIFIGSPSFSILDGEGTFPHYSLPTNNHWPLQPSDFTATFVVNTPEVLREVVPSKNKPANIQNVELFKPRSTIKPESANTVHNANDDHYDIHNHNPITATTKTVTNLLKSVTNFFPESPQLSTVTRNFLSQQTSEQKDLYVSPIEPVLKDFESPIEPVLNSYVSQIEATLNSYDSPIEPVLNSYDSPIDSTLESYSSSVETNENNTTCELQPVNKLTWQKPSIPMEQFLGCNIIPDSPQLSDATRFVMENC